jgi:hypothetical protein
MAKNYLTWRDATLRVLAEEAARLGVSEGILAAAGEIIHSSCDASLITMVTTFDQEVEAIAQRLADERTKLAHLALHDPLAGLRPIPRSMSLVIALGGAPTGEGSRP